ncbi:MAG: hypothetical protein RIS70_195 [Planctomycetota bacterium]|jgi:MFS family permease
MSGTEDEAHRSVGNESPERVRSRGEPQSQGTEPHDSELDSQNQLQPAAHSPRFMSIGGFYDYWIGDRLKFLLFLISLLTDFSVFVVVFAVSRGLAEIHVEPWYLGVVGATLSLSAGVGSILGGLLAHRFDSRAVFLAGATMIPASIFACAVTDNRSYMLLLFYWILGLGMGFLYPPLIGWLNQGDPAHGNQLTVSRRLIVFCIVWNVGMMCGQLTAGSLFAIGKHWTFGTSLVIAIANFFIAIVAAASVPRSVEVSASQHDPVDPNLLKLGSVFKQLGWIANLGGTFGGSMVMHLLPDLAVGIGVPADNHGKLLACWRAVTIATCIALHSLGFWHYRLLASLISQATGAIGLVVIARANSATTVLVGLVLLGQLVGYNYFSGLFYSTSGSSSERRVLSVGIHEATLATGMAIGTILGGVLGTLVNHRLPYLIAAIAIGVLIFVQWAAWRKWTTADTPSSV